MILKYSIIGDIDHEAFKEFHKFVTKKLLLVPTPKHPQLQITLCSDGGDAMVALAFYDLLRSINKTNCLVVVTATGLVASAAVLILAGGHVRLMNENAWLMVHDDTPGEDAVVNRRVSEVAKVLAVSSRLENQWNYIMTHNSNTDMKFWARVHAEETYMNAQEVLETGLIHSIVRRI